MTASAQLGNRPVAKGGAAGGAQIPSRGTGPAASAVLLRPLPMPPVPAPPAVRRRQAASPAYQRVLVPAARGAQTLYLPVLRLVAAVTVTVTVTVTMVVVGGLSWLGQAREPGLPARTAVARVGAGETVWDVAARVAPQSDRRAVVERIRQLNGLVDSAVSPDQRLQVPVGR